jgi:hypothetical protein
MSPYWRFRMRALMVASAIAGLRFAGPACDDATAAGLPKDPCALLKPADIQALAPNARIASGVPSTQPPLGVSCQYSWGPRTPAWGETTLNISVVDASKVYPGGLSADDIKQRVLVMVQTGGPNASEIPGIGDGAAFTFETRKRTTSKGEVLTTGDAKTTAFVVKAKGVILDVTLHDGSDALAQKDKLIALLKAAAAAL